jgi:hypothetical protein
MKDKSRLTLMSVAIVATLSAAAPAGAAETTTSGTSSSTSPPLSPGESKVIGKSADSYSAFAGSRTNAENLATGLRRAEVTLTSTNADGVTTSTTFRPPTKPNGARQRR